MTAAGEPKIWDWQESVGEFHRKTLIPIGWTPGALSTDRLKLRLNLFDEFFELLAAAGVEKAKELEDVVKHNIRQLDGTRQDIVEMADALGDIVVVAFGMAIEMGVDLNQVLEEIMRANMSKLDENGNPLINYCQTKEDEPVEHDCELNADECEFVDPTQPADKVLKASGYRPPDVKSVLESQAPLSQLYTF